jgi:hypothetical protein
MRFGHIDNAKDVARLARLNQQPKSEGAAGTEGPRAEDKGRAGTVVIVARIFGCAGVFHFEARFDVFQQARLHPQDRLGIVIEIGIGVRPGGEGQCE